MTDANTANRSYLAGVPVRPTTNAGASPSAALPGRPPRLRQFCEERSATADCGPAAHL